MNKTALKNFAIAARLELLGRVKDRAALYGVTREKVEAHAVETSARFQKLGGEMLSRREIAQRNALLGRVALLGFDQAMEEAAYTWFNRFIALRYMQEHNLLPVDVRALPQAAGELPQIVREAQNVSLPGVDIASVVEMLDANRTEELYKYLLIALCNALSAPLPRMFEAIEDYTELLFPDGILKAESVLGMLAGVEAENWRDIQVIGWMYQYYNTEPKDRVFANLKKNIKIEAKDIPAATQLFTPDWIVRYMVENSLGRLWLEGHPNDALKSNWRYYLDEAEQEPEVQAKLDELRAGYAALRPEVIQVIDPCCGSGHIAVYMFDVLMQIYETQGWTRRDAARSILENNLYALDIDDRAAQLAYFAVMMRAAEYDPRFLRRGEMPQPQVYAIAQSAPVAETTLASLGRAKLLVARLVAEFADAKTLGSIIRPTLTPDELATIRAELSRGDMAEAALLEQLNPLLTQSEILSRQYDAVVTNPPYMGASGMGDKLSKFVKDNYPDSKADLFAVFIERCAQFAKPNRFQAMITQHAWMFLSSFEKLRGKLMAMNTVSMAHLGARAFEEIGGEVVQTTSFVLRKVRVPGYKGTYARLVEPTTQRGKEDMFLSGENRYAANQDNFAKIPGAPVAYWVSDKFIEAFTKGMGIESIAKVPKGLSTGSVEKFMRYWYEIIYSKIGFESTSCEQSREHMKKWFPYAKGGAFRRWGGNLEYVVNWENDGYEVKHFVDESGKQRSRPQNTAFYFRECATYSAITSYKYSVRYLNRSIFGGGGDSIHVNKKELFYVLGILNSSIAQTYLSVISPTINFEVDHIKKLPIIFDYNKKSMVEDIVMQNRYLSTRDWDSFETSWDFQRHPLI